jgi:hypothetical protein
LALLKICVDHFFTLRFIDIDCIFLC